MNKNLTMDYNNRMKKSNHSRSKQYLATVLEDREGTTQKAYHSKRKSEEEASSLIQLPQEHFLITNHSQFSANSYENQYRYPQQFNKYKRGGYQRISYENVQERKRNIVTTETVATFTQRLQNIHEHYKSLIDEQKMRNNERTEIILSVLDQLQASHQDKLHNMRRMIEQAEDEKKEVGFVDDKMNEIKSNIEQLINQSGTLKQKNDTLTKKIEQKRKNNELKEGELQQIKEQALQTRNELEEFEIKNIKNNRVNKQIIEIFKTASSMEQNQ